MVEDYSVLQEETINGLSIKPDGTYVDCTVGGGGQAVHVASRLDENGLLGAFDQEIDALQDAKARVQPYQDRVLFMNEDFRSIEQELNHHDVRDVDGILFDLGVSSPQLDRGERGFSYQHDAQLDMRMNQTQALSAFEIVNTWPYEQLVSIFFKRSEEHT